jgi:hypothetical protein
MLKLVPSETMRILTTKAYLYDIAVNKFLLIAEVLVAIVIVLIVVVIIQAIFYKIKKGECKYYKDCLNANFYWKL